MNHSESIVKLSFALTKAQAELKSAPFNKKNPFLNNRPYADLGSHIDTAKPVLAKYGLAVSQLVTSDGDGKIGVETVLLHESGEWISALVMLPPSEEKGKSSAQVAGSIISYFRRYSLAAILGMYSDEEDDGAGSPSQPGTQTQGQRAAANKTQAGEKPTTQAPAGNGNGTQKAAAYVPEQWTPETAAEVVTPKKTKIGSLNTDDLSKFIAGVDVAKKENKPEAIDNPELDRAYDAAKFLVAHRTATAK